MLDYGRPARLGSKKSAGVAVSAGKGGLIALT
jgi:hypothetical protein